MKISEHYGANTPIAERCGSTCDWTHLLAEVVHCMLPKGHDGQHRTANPTLASWGGDPAEFFEVCGTT